MTHFPAAFASVPVATSGEIAVSNHHSVRRRAWARFWQAPEHPGLAEAVVEQEDIAAQYLGDVAALDRLGLLVNRLEEIVTPSEHVPLVLAQIASMEHRFTDATALLKAAERQGAPQDPIRRLALAIDQACGKDLETVLAVRRQAAEASGKLEDLVPLGALLADLGNYDAADQAYKQALLGYDDVSPFALAWVCFQLGMLWGEVAAEPDAERAELWYRQALHYLPIYARARIHLAEILIDKDRLSEAEALLAGIIGTGDPEVHWRLADHSLARGNRPEADKHLAQARALYDVLLAKHPLAYADHSAEFYIAGGGDPARALDLARLNLANRPTLRAFELALKAANMAGDAIAASEICDACKEYWGVAALDGLLQFADEMERR